MRYGRIWLAVSMALGAIGSAVAFEKVPAEVVRALGTTRGKMVSSGLVFIDGKYLRAPYRVTRFGTQILINDRPVTGQLVAWEKFLETQSPSKLKAKDAGDPPETEDPVDPAAPKDGGNAPTPDGETAKCAVVIEETRLGADADDLDDFDPNGPERMKLTEIPADTDEDKARQKRGEEARKDDEREKAEETKSPDEEKPENALSGEGEEEIDPASPEGEAAARAAEAKKPEPPPDPKPVREGLTLEGAFDMNFRAQKLLKPIEDRRAGMEKVLRRGGFLFIGTGARPYLKGAMSDAVWTKELLKKLPEILSAAEGEESFCDAVRSAGLFNYINMQVAQDLFRHKVDSIYLKQRRREIADEEKITRMTR